MPRVRQAGRQNDRQADRQTDRQTDKQAGRQAGRQTDRYTDTTNEKAGGGDAETETAETHLRSAMLAFFPHSHKNIPCCVRANEHGSLTYRTASFVAFLCDRHAIGTTIPSDERK
jgi:hypothetical protein